MVHRRTIPGLLLALAALVSTERASACPPYGYWTPLTCPSDTAAAWTNVHALMDPSGELQYLFWHSSADSTIRWTRRSLPEPWGDVETVAHTAFAEFGAPVDSSGDLHVVWADTSGLGPPGVTSILDKN